MTTVFTQGCFDGLHAGHLLHLRKCRKQGDSLIVGLNDDAYCRRKSDSRPFHGAENRAASLFDTGLVNGVIIFAGETPLPLILRLKPEVICVGGLLDRQFLLDASRCDWKPRLFCTGPRTPGLSTTEISHGLR